MQAEAPRLGEDGPDECWRCQKGDELTLWSDQNWRLGSLDKPTGLPVIVILESREHLDLGELDDDRAGELGRLIVRVERAVQSLGNIGRVHVGRWGDGSAHLHVWFMARPARLPQVRTSFAAIWDDILPPVPDEIWRRDLVTVARTLAEDGGTAHV
jgi:diadenosine tetraphosphate (Ap4A) HIT family hydrolase